MGEVSYKKFSVHDSCIGVILEEYAGVVGDGI